MPLGGNITQLSVTAADRLLQPEMIARPACVRQIRFSTISTTTHTTLDASRSQRATLCASRETCVVYPPSRLNPARCHSYSSRYRFVPIGFVYLMSIKSTEHNDMKT